MKRLSGAKPGYTYRLIWFIGEAAQFVKNIFSLEENSFVRIISNAGDGAVIFAFRDRRIALSGDVAGRIVID